jgi:hypothetical protein
VRPTRNGDDSQNRILTIDKGRFTVRREREGSVLDSIVALRPERVSGRKLPNH